MIPIPHSLSPVLPGVPAPVLLLALLGVSLFLIFAGRTLAKVVAFLAVGIIGAAFGGSIAVQYLAPQWQILGLLLGFVIGGLLGVVLLPLGVGLAVGYAGYVVALELALGPTAAIIAGVALFVVGALLSSKILSVATALIGGFCSSTSSPTTGSVPPSPPWWPRSLPSPGSGSSSSWAGIRQSRPLRA